MLASLVAHHAATTLEARIAESETALANREAEALADIVGSLEAGSTEDELVLHAVEGIRAVCGYHTVEVHLTATDDPRNPAWSPPRSTRAHRRRRGRTGSATSCTRRA